MTKTIDRSALVCAPVLSGARWGATQQSRVTAAHLAAALSVVGIILGTRVRTLLVAASWASAWLVVVAGTFSDPARTLHLAVPALVPWWPTLLTAVGLAAVLSARGHALRLLRRHRQLLSADGPRSAGLVVGLLALEYPILLLVAAQAARLTTAAGAWLVLAALLAAVMPPMMAAGHRAPGTPGRRLWLPAVLAGIALLMQVADGLLPAAGGRWPTSLPAPGWPITTAAACAAAAGASTMLTARWLGRRRLAPRSGRMERAAGVIVLAGVALSWSGQAVLEAVGRAELVPGVPLLASFAVALLLRTRLARYLSPEARGYGLFLLRDVPGADARIHRHYTVNALVLLAPTMAAAAVQLVVAGWPATVLLLATLFVVELVGDVVVVQRHTVVVPAGDLDQLGLMSRGGLAAAGCFVLSVTAGGVIGFNTPFHFGDPASVLGVCALLGGTAALLAVRAVLDTPGWLAGLTATRVEVTQ